MSAEKEGLFHRLRERRLDNFAQKLAQRAIRLNEEGYSNQMLPVTLGGNVFELIGLRRTLPEEAYDRANETLAEEGLRVVPRVRFDGVEMAQNMVVEQILPTEQT